MSNIIFEIGKRVGMSEDEIRWTFDRLKQLQRNENVNRIDALARVKEEAKGKPWLKSSTT